MKITAKDYDNNYFKPLVEAYVNQNSWSMNRVSRLDVIDVNGKFVLDLGCGMGTFTIESEKRGAVSIGADYSLDALKSARKLRRDIKVVRCDSQKLPFKDGVFDWVLMMDFVEHLYHDQYVVTCEEVDRVLKSHGGVLIYTPKPHARVIPKPLINFYNKYVIGMDYYDKTHVGEKTPSEIIKEFKNYSYNIYIYWVLMRKSYMDLENYLKVC